MEKFINFIKKIPTIAFLAIIIIVDGIIVLPYGIVYLPEDAERYNVWLMWLTIILVLAWTGFALIFSIFYFKWRQDIYLDKKYKKTVKKYQKKLRKKSKKLN